MSIERICIVTNGNLTRDGFGERGNAKGIGEVRIAEAWKNDKVKFVVQTLDESDSSVEPPPSENLFRKYSKEIVKARQNAVFCVHGFNTSFKKSLREAWDIHKTYGTGVILFSWPSIPGGNIREEYQKARIAASASSAAFNNTLEKLQNYLRRAIDVATRKGRVCHSTFNLMCFSQGSYLLQKIHSIKTLWKRDALVYECCTYAG